MTAVALTLVGCGDEILDWRNAEISSNKVFAGNANKPFSGKVTNVPYSKILSGQRGYNTLMGQGGAIVTALQGNALLCDVGVSGGVLEGTFTCRQGSSEKPQMEGAFKSGGLSGKFTIRDARTDKVVTEATFEDGALDGTLKRWDSSTGTKTLEQTISRNLAQGAFKMWDKDTGKLIVDGRFVEGKPDGEFRKFDPQGNELERSNYSKGVLNGPSRKSDASGAELENGAYSENVFTGMRLRRIATDDGSIIDQVPVKVVNDIIVETPDAQKRISAAEDLRACVTRKLGDFHFKSAPALEHCRALSKQQPVDQMAAVEEDRADFPEESNECTTAWEDAFRKERGEEAPINFAMAWEFVDNCRAGKRPR